MTTIIVLLIAGALLLALETILPGLISGIIGFCCICAAVVLGYSRFDFQTGNTILAIAIGGLIIGTLIYIKYFPHSKVAKLFVSERAIGNVDAENPALLHQTGKSITSLRPSGAALINGQRIDVVTEGSFIEPNRPIKVIALEGLRVVVREV